MSETQPETLTIGLVPTGGTMPITTLARLLQATNRLLQSVAKSQKRRVSIGIENIVNQDGNWTIHLTIDDAKPKKRSRKANP